MQLHLVVNPAAGRDQPVLAIANRVFGKASAAWDVTVTHGPDDARDAARAARAAGASCIVACGGDGTVSEVAEALVGTGTALGILPCGTGNVVAQELGIPKDLEEAAQWLVSPDAERRAVDTMRCGGRTYLQRIGIGAEARAILGASAEQKSAGGWAAYAMHGVEELGAVGSVRFQIVADGEVLDVDAVTCVIANCGRMGRSGLSLAPGIDPCDGLLDLLILERSDVLGVGAMGLSSLGLREGAATPSQGLGRGPLHHFAVRRVEIRTEEPQSAHADGDELPPGAHATSWTVEIAPASVSVLVPPASS